MSTAAASQYCGTLATQRAGNQTQRVSLVKQSRGRSADPGSVFGRVITNRKSLQAGHRRPLPSFVYKGLIGAHSDKVAQWFAAPEFIFCSFYVARVSLLLSLDVLA